MALSANETYWYQGLPFTGIGTGSGTETYWFNGLPFGFIEPAVHRATSPLPIWFMDGIK